MRKKFNFKRFALFLAAVICVSVFVFNGKEITYTSYKTIAKLLYGSNDVTLTLTKQDDTHSWSLSGQTILYTNTESNVTYYINIFKEGVVQPFELVDDTYVATLDSGSDYIVEVVTDSELNADPTDLCFDAFDGCLWLEEQQQDYQNGRKARSGELAFSENMDLNVTLRMKTMCDRVNCEISGMNVQMESAGGYVDAEHDNVWVNLYYGAVSTHVYDGEDSLTYATTTRYLGSIDSNTYEWIDERNWDDVDSVLINIDLLSNDEERAGILEWVQVQRLYNVEDQIMVYGVADEEYAEYGTIAWDTDLNTTIVSSGVTVSVEEVNIMGHMVRPYAVLVTGRIRSVNEQPMPGNTEYTITFGGTYDSENNEITYNVGGEDVVIDATPLAGLIVDDALVTNNKDAFALTIDNYDFGEMTAFAVSTIENDDFQTPLDVWYDSEHEEYILFFRPSDPQVMSLPSSFRVDILPGGNNQFEQNTIEFSLAEIEDNSALFDIDNDGGVDVIATVIGYDEFDSPFDVEIDSETKKFNYTRETFESVVTHYEYQDEEWVEVEDHVNGQRIREKILLSGYEIKDMDVWLYAEDYNSKLSPLNNDILTYEKVDEDYILTIESPYGWFPNTLKLAVTKKYEYPEDMNNFVSFTFEHDDTDVTVDENVVTFDLGEDTVNLVINSDNEAINIRPNLLEWNEPTTVEYHLDVKDLDEVEFSLVGFDPETMEITYDMSGARGVVNVIYEDEVYKVDFSNIVLNNWMDLRIDYISKETFDGRAYFVWVCGDNDYICYHYVTNLSGRTFLTNSEGLIILDDNGEPFQSFTINYIPVETLTDQSGHGIDFITLVNGTIENGVSDINSIKSANWVRAKDVEVAPGEFDNNLTKSDIFGISEEDFVALGCDEFAMPLMEIIAEHFESSPEEITQIIEETFGDDYDTVVTCFKGRLDLDPTGGVSGQNSNTTNGDRNFRATIYTEDYVGITFDASPLNYTFFPSYWDQVFFTDTRDITGSSEDYPIEYETYLLEPYLRFKTGAYSAHNIVSVEAINVSGKAVTIDNNEGIFTITFNSNYYDKVEFRLTDEAGNEYYLLVNRNLVNIWNRDDKVYFELYYPIDFMYDDFKVVATIYTREGESLEIINASAIEYEDTNFYIEEGTMYQSGGKNLFFSQYALDISEYEDIESIYFTVVLDDAFDDEDTYGGTFAGSGKGFMYIPEEEHNYGGEE